MSCWLLWTVAQSLTRIIAAGFDVHPTLHCFILFVMFHIGHIHPCYSNYWHNHLNRSTPSLSCHCRLIPCTFLCTFRNETELCFLGCCSVPLHFFFLLSFSSHAWCGLTPPCWHILIFLPTRCHIVVVTQFIDVRGGTVQDRKACRPHLGEPNCIAIWTSRSATPSFQARLSLCQFALAPLYEGVHDNRTRMRMLPILIYSERTNLV